MQLRAETIGVIVGIVGVALVWYQLYLQTRLARFTALQELHAQVGTPEFRRALRRVIHATDDEVTNVDDHGPTELREAVEAVSGLYDLMGARFQDRILPRKGTLKTEWRVLGVLWPKLKGFVDKRAAGRGTPYKEHLKLLAEEAEEYQKRHYRKARPRVNDGEVARVGEVGQGEDGHSVIGRGKWLELRRGQTGWEYAHRLTGKGGVSILPLTREGSLILVEQYRPPLRAAVLELPAGLIADEPAFAHESIVDAVNRELEEETGYTSHSIEVLARGPFLPGLTDEENVICLARDSVRSFDVHESATVVHEVALEQILLWLKNKRSAGTTIDLRIYAALSLLPRDEARRLHQRSE